MNTNRPIEIYQTFVDQMTTLNIPGYIIEYLNYDHFRANHPDADRRIAELMLFANDKFMNECYLETKNLELMRRAIETAMIDLKFPSHLMEYVCKISQSSAIRILSSASNDKFKKICYVLRRTHEFFQHHDKMNLSAPCEDPNMTFKPIINKKVIMVESSANNTIVDVIGKNKKNDDGHKDQNNIVPCNKKSDDRKLNTKTCTIDHNGDIVRSDQITVDSLFDNQCMGLDNSELEARADPALKKMIDAAKTSSVRQQLRTRYNRKTEVMVPQSFRDTRIVYNHSTQNTRYLTYLYSTKNISR